MNALAVSAIALFALTGVPQEELPATEDVAGVAGSAESREVPGAAELEALRLAVSEDPDDPAARRRLATALRAANQDQEAVEHLEAAARTGPATVGVLIELAVTYGRLSRMDEAEAVYRQILESVPGEPRSLNNLGNLAMRQGEIDEAIALYREAVTSDPSLLQGWNHMGKALRLTGRFDEAMAAYAKVVEREPVGPAGWRHRIEALIAQASIHLEREDAKSAEALLADVVRAAPDHPRAHYARARALMMLGRHDEAKQEIDLHMKLLARRPQVAPVAR